ncbi:MAG: lysophospholipid acyltransferase family protein [Methylococcaceae bacterium]|jgi:1-acyl-sn-glycerol-3-phosphate acyltransferase
MTPQAKSHHVNNYRVYLGSTLLFACILSTATLIGIIILVLTPFPYSARNAAASFWCQSITWLAKVLCGVNYKVEGLEHLQQQDTAIVLSKHQSAWETLAFRHIFPKHSVLLKQSLLWMPIWGWALATLKPIAINREQQRAALRILLKKGVTYINEGLWVVIFPEGTRTAPGEFKKFNAGGAILAHKTGCPVIPVAHNAGEFWSRYSFLKYPGTIQVKIGQPIQTKGLTIQEINSQAEAWINQAMQEIDEQKQAQMPN